MIQVHKANFMQFSVTLPTFNTCIFGGNRASALFARHYVMVYSFETHRFRNSNLGPSLTMSGEFFPNHGLTNVN